MRRRVPIRLRISITYAGLFLATGGILVALTYGLVAHNLDTSPVRTPTPDRRVLAYCKSALSGGAPSPLSTTLPPGVVLPPKRSLPSPKESGLAARCKAVFSAGADVGAADKRDQALHHLLIYSLIGLGGLTLASGALGWLLAGRVLAPVRAVTAAARRLSAHNLDERLALEGPRDELRDLADTFDAMLARLDAAFSSQHRFIGNASHELRTPLTIMRTELDVTLDRPESTVQDLRRMGGVVRDAVARSERLVDSLLELATSEAGLDRQEAMVLTALVAASLERVGPMARSKEISLRSDLAPEVTATGVPELVQRLVDNLLDNAVLHNHSGGWAHVALRAKPGSAHLVVSNSGPEISEADLEVMFQPFRRLGADRQRSDRGVGLGLAIVSAIVAAHHGSLTATPIPGGGLQLSVEVPASERGGEGSEATAAGAAPDEDASKDPDGAGEWALDAAPRTPHG